MDVYQPEEYQSAFSSTNKFKSKVVSRWERKLEERTSRQNSISDPSVGNHDEVDVSKSSFNLSRGDELSSENKQSDGDYRILAYREKLPTPEAGYQNQLNVLYSKNIRTEVATTLPTRHLPNSPERILNAPDLRDDYYLNLIDWGSNSVLAIALEDNVYLFNSTNGNLASFAPCSPGGYVCSVSWLKDGGNILAVGTTDNDIQLWDGSSQQLIRRMDGHTDRVSSLAWNHHILSSGSRDTTIVNHDVRVSQHQIGVYRGHEQEVCGLTWSYDGALLASGGNDNRLCVFDSTAGNSAPQFVFVEHMAAVKAVAWCPYQRHHLASGGGSSDRCIKLWNVTQGSMLRSIDTGSQVCCLKWNPHEKELLSSHGYAKNQLCLWKYPSMELIKEFYGHSARILHMAVSPDGTYVCSAGPDEKMCIWKLFGTSNYEKKTLESAPLNTTYAHLR